MGKEATDVQSYSGSDEMRHLRTLADAKKNNTASQLCATADSDYTVMCSVCQIAWVPVIVRLLISNEIISIKKKKKKTERKDEILALSFSNRILQLTSLEPRRYQNSLWIFLWLLRFSLCFSFLRIHFRRLYHIKDHIFPLHNANKNSHC